MKPASYKNKSHIVDRCDLMSATELPIEEPFAECKHLASDFMECYAYLRVRSCQLHTLTLTSLAHDVDVGAGRRMIFAKLRPSSQDTHA